MHTLISVDRYQFSSSSSERDCKRCDAIQISFIKLNRISEQEIARGVHESEPLLSVAREVEYIELL